MAEDVLDQSLFAEAPETPAVEAVPEPAPQPTPEAPVEAAPTPEPVAPEAPAPEQHTVPLAKYLDQRDELKELRRFKQEAEAQKQPQSVPDPIDDPNGFRAAIQSDFQRELTARTFNMSDLMAKQVHGEEAVEAAKTWAQERAGSDPGFVQGYMTAQHPIDWIVRQHKQDADLASYQTDPVAFARKILEAAGEQIAPPAAQVPTQAAPVIAVEAPPKSLASEAGGTGPVVDDKGDFLAALLR